VLSSHFRAVELEDGCGRIVTAKMAAVERSRVVLEIAPLGGLEDLADLHGSRSGHGQFSYKKWEGQV
jgi:hypothetical protein